MVSHIRDFEFIVTGSEKEALLLEINLIKKHTPPYNIMFMDDKTYPYIEITKENNFVVRTTRNIKNKKNEYFGPYPSSQSAYEIVKLINQIFCVRKCRHIPDSPCLYYHMHQCLGPCINDIDPKENEKTRKKIKKFLQGDTKEVMDSLQSKMLEASENLQFEKAQEIYNTIQALQHVIEKQTIDFKDRANRDVFGYYVDSGYISFQGFFIRQGKLLERNMSITPLYEDEMDAFTSFIVQYYEKNVVPKEILVPEGTPVDVLKEALNTNVHIPVRGEKKKLIDLVYKNAKEAHEQKFKLVFRKDNELKKANDMLGEIFKTDIHTVEMFDNSHIQGTFNVSGLVVFKDGIPDKNSYRHYKLDGYRSDVDSMKEVIYRRYYRVLVEGLKKPDLIIVDGGKGQIKVAKEVIDSLNIGIKVCGLAKDDHHSTAVLIDSDFNEISIDKKSELFFLLTRMQDEVHRYAISFHKNVRSKSLFQSILDDVEGIGPKRKKELLKHFGSVKKLKEATLEQLEEVLPKEVAKNLFTVLQNTK